MSQKTKLPPKTDLSSIISQSLEEKGLEHQIVYDLFNTDDKLFAKTDMSKPIDWSILKILKDYVKDQNLPISLQILENFIITSMKYMISKGRKGRLEYIEALHFLTNLTDNNNLMNGNPLNPR